MTYVKICGLTNLEDALVAVDVGADYLGFIFYEKSPRYVSFDAFAEIAKGLPDGVRKVGVFVNASQETVMEAIKRFGLTFVQLHGEEPPAFVHSFPQSYKAIRPESVEAFRGLAEKYVLPNMATRLFLQPCLLVDTWHPTLHGGTGQQMSMAIALEAKATVPSVMLAGGLTPENVGAFVQQVQPFAVDVSSGVEASPGKKDHGKVRAFIQAVRENNS